MNNKDKSLYQSFAGTMNAPDEYQRHEIDKLLAKLSIISLYIFLALLYLSIFFDIERSFISPFSIGGIIFIIILACRMSMSHFAADAISIEVTDKETYHRTLKNSRNKRIIFLIVAITYILLVNSVIAPMLAGNALNMERLTDLNTFFPVIVIAVFTIAKDSRVKLIDQKETYDGK
ncbi:hypothetical protein [Staphylococcus parequorum]|uniref:hypothetical protein n=1 Tax=unclassified Staphylococcus TaxID=91994 RepID=UPI003365F0A6